MFENFNFDYIKECIRYENGKLYWLKRPLNHFYNERICNGWNTKYAYLEAGTQRKSKRNNYWVIKINYLVIYRSNLVWILHYGEWPLNEVDHEDRNPINDKIENLRLATHMQNSMNRRIYSNNTSGYTGVYFNKNMNQYKGDISANGERIHLGYFDTAEKAAEARRKAAIIYHGDFASDGK